MIHGFVDGYSRLIVGLRAHTDNTAKTVLQLFLEACAERGVPRCVRGDRGVENVGVAAFMFANRALGERLRYIFGKYVRLGPGLGVPSTGNVMDELIPSDLSLSQERS